MWFGMNSRLDVVPRAVAGGIGDGRVDRQCMSEVRVGNSLSDVGIVWIGSLGLQAEVEHLHWVVTCAPGHAPQHRIRRLSQVIEHHRKLGSAATTTFCSLHRMQSENFQSRPATTVVLSEFHVGGSEVQRLEDRTL